VADAAPVMGGDAHDASTIPLRESAVVGAVHLEPLINLDVVVELVLGDGPVTGVARPGEINQSRVLLQCNQSM
jgi:hypothetical protein